MNYEEKNKVAADKALDILIEYLNEKRPGGAMIKVAGNTVTNYHRLLATKGSNDLLKYGICRDISGDRKELKELVKKQIPHMSPK